MTGQSTETVPGTRIHTRVAGLPTNAPTALLLHGIGGSSASFEAQFPAFGEVRHVIAWDAPGYGASADPDAAPGMAGYAAAAASLLQNGGPADIVGVSWGGVIATRLALAYPELVRTLVLADSTRGSGRTREGRAGMARRAEALTAQGPEAFAAQRGPNLVSEHASPALVGRIVANMADSLRQPGYRYATASMAETDHSQALAGLLAPTLVLVGELDAVTGVAESRFLAQAIPGARSRLIAEAGHCANQERPAEFNRAVLEFWESAC